MEGAARHKQVIVGAMLSVLTGLVVYVPWVILESLDFMSPPRRVANIGLLLFIFIPVVGMFGALSWIFTKANLEFFKSMIVSSFVVLLIVIVIHQAAVTARWKQSPEGKREEETVNGAAAWNKLVQPSAVATLQPPLDRYELAALASRVRTPDIDGAALHHVLVTFPKQVDCDIVQNPNAFSDDLAAIWNEHACVDYYFTVSPHASLEIIRAILDSHRGEGLDQWGRMARDEAALRLAKESCDPELLYSLFEEKGEFALDTKIRLQIRLRMAANVCTPRVVREQMESPPELKQAAASGETYRRMARSDRKVWEAQEWFPRR